MVVFTVRRYVLAVSSAANCRHRAGRITGITRKAKRAQQKLNGRHNDRLEESAPKSADKEDGSNRTGQRHPGIRDSRDNTNSGYGNPKEWAHNHYHHRNNAGKYRKNHLKNST